MGDTTTATVEHALCFEPELSPEVEALLESEPSEQPLVVIAGASGFVGASLRIALADRYRWRALTRSEAIVNQHEERDNTEWRLCDLYSLPKVEAAMEGADYAIYLVHSMLPSSRLVQAKFEDLDLLLADNFARAAEAAGVKHIIYLGGLIPPDDYLSPHLRSRQEVEHVLRSRNVPVTVLRAGLIIGPGGSSLRILINLVRRLPVMLMPKWTHSETHSIDIRDTIRAFGIALDNRNFWDGTYDLGGHEPMTYRAMILRTAEILSKHPVTIDLPINWFAVSRQWVATLSGVSSQLVNPLLESLRHSLHAQDNPLLDRIKPQAIAFEDSLRSSLDPDGAPLPNPRSRTQKTDDKLIKKARRVRSVQRMPLPSGWDAPYVAQIYGQWLTDKSIHLINVQRDADNTLRFMIQLAGIKIKLLELTPTPYTRGGGRRRAFYISGGFLARQVDPPGRFEFRIFPENYCLIAAIHGFAPRLPWWIYETSQAVVHYFVMKAFGKYLWKQAKAGVSMPFDHDVGA
ncbi:NAD(P)H-binding protein [Cerasicoccus arenae]|uniref:Nucleoside-diphosphate sugar epimerase n=1 Tax=Cerasicoccus arenae TaxID=424488 RepID=A0A8J3GFC8_9BACT|nr:NAD(P)H-binding protein [Cerasicoccus arenae]MBK1857650.1 NAD(P)H-binding protein [Cerasicoccus arenae]GHC05323.1 nucleoside-diphosphate sugar epimerase [Cerasicoccus arenae]